MQNFFQKEIETASQDQLQEIQSKRLVEVVNHVYTNNALQKKRFDEAGVAPSDIKNVSDVAKLPMLDKEIFRTSFPLGLSCVPQNELAEMHMSSGSTGTPVVMPYTEADLQQWSECMARCYYMAGAQKGDPIQITPTFGLFNGGFGMYHGARAGELFIIPTSSGNTKRQVNLAKSFNTKIITGVVSYGIRIMEVMEAMKEQLPALKIGIFGAEVLSPSMKEKIEQGLGIEVFDIYGMTETGGVGTLGQDCSAHEGIHLWDDHYIAEIIDPSTGLILPDGKEGELVITSITRQALPVIRFKTGDVTKIISRDLCSCGRTHTRIAPATGRADDMMIVKGVNFFPRQVEEALMSIPGVGANYQIILEEEDGVRDVRINVEAEEGVTGFTVVKALKEALGFSPKGDVFALGELPRQAGKAKRVFKAGESDAILKKK